MDAPLPRVFLIASAGLERQVNEFAEQFSAQFSVHSVWDLQDVELGDHDVILLCTDDIFFASYSTKAGVDENLHEAVAIVLEHDSYAMLWVHEGEVEQFVDASFPESIQPLLSRKVLQFPDRGSEPAIDFKRDVLPFLKRMTSENLIDGVAVLDYVANHLLNPLSNVGNAAALLDTIQNKPNEPDASNFDWVAQQLLTVQALFVQHAYREAEETLQSIDLEGFDEDVTLLREAVDFYHGWCSLKRGKLEDAKARLARLAASNENTVQVGAMVLLAEIALEQGDPRQAEQLLEDAGQVDRAPADVKLSRLRVSALAAFATKDQPRLDKIAAEAEELLEFGHIPINSYNRRAFEMVMSRELKSSVPAEAPRSSKGVHDPFESSAEQVASAFGSISRWIAEKFRAVFQGRPNRPIGRMGIIALMLLPFLLALSAFGLVRTAMHDAGAGGEMTAGYDPASAYSVAVSAHKGAVTSIDVSRDGAFVISAGTDGMVRLWDEKGTLVAAVPAPYSSVPTVEFAQLPTGDGEFVVVLSKPPLFVAETLDGSPDQEPLAPNEYYRSESGFLGVIEGGPDTSWVALQLPDLQIVDQTILEASDFLSPLNTMSILEGFGARGLFESDNKLATATTLDGNRGVGYAANQHLVIYGFSEESLEAGVWRLGELPKPAKLIGAGRAGHFVMISHDGQGYGIKTKLGKNPEITDQWPLLAAETANRRTLPIDLTDSDDLLAEKYAFIDGTRYAQMTFVRDQNFDDIDQLVALDGLGLLNILEGVSPGAVQKESFELLGRSENSTVLVVRDQELNVYGAEATELIASAPAPRNFINPLQARDGTIYAIAEDRESLIIWRSPDAKGGLRASTSRFADRVIALAPVPGTDRIAALGASGDQSFVFIFEGGEVIVKQTLEQRGPPVAFTITSNGALLIAYADGRVVSSLPRGNSLQDLALPLVLDGSLQLSLNHPATAIELSPNQDTLAILDDRLGLRLYDLSRDDPELTAIVQPFEENPTRIATPMLDFSTDGRLLAVLDSSGALRVFSMTAIADEVINRTTLTTNAIVCRNCLAVGVAEGAYDTDAGVALTTNLFSLDGEGRVRRWDYKKTTPHEDQDAGYLLDGSPIFVRRLGQWGNPVYGIAYADGRVELRHFGTYERVGSVIEGFSATPTALDGTPNGELMIVGTAAGTLRFVRPSLHQNLKRYDIFHKLHRWIEDAFAMPDISIL